MTREHQQHPAHEEKAQPATNRTTIEGELITTWSPILTKTLYQNGELNRTVTYHKLIKRCNFEITRNEIKTLLCEINEEGYRRYKIFLMSLAVRDSGPRLPDEEWFYPILKEKKDTQTY
ncbi:MAG: hypothetical protein KF803_02530 [Cyclobacteriaceae bacterium]|nr:hypothetical protein [Cyclobacteriaceae bacterium]